MRRILEDIQNNTFHKVYLLYGEEDYLKRQFRDKLIDAVIPKGDTMNLTRFGEGVSCAELMEAANAMPFFMAERRLVVAEKTGFFAKTPEGFVDFLKEIPDTTILVFNEGNTDGRCASMNAIKKAGLAVQFNRPDQKTLSDWVKSRIKKEGMSITAAALTKFLANGDADMESMDRELEKLTCYCLDKGTIEEEDVVAVCLPDIQTNIWNMIDAFAGHNPSTAFAEYRKLLAVRESPLRVLSLMERHIRLIYSSADLASKGLPAEQIAQRLDVRDFAVRNYLRQSKAFTRRQLLDMLDDMADAEEKCKSRRLREQAAVELMISKYCML